MKRQADKKLVEQQHSSISRQRVLVNPVQGLFLAEIRGKDDHLYAVDATK